MRKLRLLVYGINYHPEEIGIGKYTTEMCEWLAGEQHSVEVITGMPYYPFWKIFEPYRGKAWHTDEINGVTVRRCPMYVPGKVTGKSRIIHELSFAFSSSIYWFICLFKKYDAVICIAPPFQTGMAGLLYKIFHRTVLIYHIQDLQVDAAKQLGLIKSSLLLKLITSAEKLILKRSDFVSTISEGMKRKILSKGIASKKIISLNNWIDTAKMVPEQADPEMRRSFGIEPSKKIVLYSGNIGEKQGLEILIPVADWLREENLEFLIIGDGAFKNTLQALAVEKKLDNVKMFPLQPKERLNKVLNLADIHLVLQKKAAADLVMPSKLTAILSVGGLALVTTEKDTALHDIIQDHRLAIIVEPENPIALRDAIVDALRNNSDDYKANARKYAISALEKETIMKEFVTFLMRPLQ